MQRKHLPGLLAVALIGVLAAAITVLAAAGPTQAQNTVAAGGSGAATGGVQESHDFFPVGWLGLLGLVGLAGLRRTAPAPAPVLANRNNEVTL